MSEVVEVQCPVCGEATAIDVDPWALQGAGAQGVIVVESDCQVCCRPLHASVRVVRGRVTSADAAPGW